MESGPWKTDDWWVSHYNHEEEVKKRYPLPESVEIHDATLRDGEQTAGVVFRKEDKIKIARALDEVGINRIEAGMPAVSEDDYEAIKEIASLGLNSKIMAFCRGNIKDVEMAVRCGVWGVIIELPVGRPRLKYQFNWSEDQVIEKAVTSVKRAKELGLHVTFFPYETTRAKLSFVKRLITLVEKEAKADAVAVVDTVGCSLPETIYYLVKEVKKTVSVPVEVHCHNDFGLGLANELAGLAAGASILHGCVNGLGERAGNVATEELVAAIRVLLNRDMGMKLSKLKSLANLVSSLSGIAIPTQKAIVGDNVFSREISVGMDLLFNNPLAIMALRAPAVGNKTNILLGKKSGATSIKVRLNQLGLEAASDEEIMEITKLVKERAVETKRTLSDEEFLGLVKQIIKLNKEAI